MAYGLDVGYVRGGYKSAGLVRCMRNDTLSVTATQRRDRFLFERGLKPHDRNRKYGLQITRNWKSEAVITCNYTVITLHL